MSFPRYPKYRDAGIEWLREIPEHWDLTAVKRFTDMITDGAHVSPETDNGVYPFVSTKDVVDGSIDFQNSLQTSATSFVEMVKNGCRPQVGDVLFSKDGTIGRTVVVKDERDFVVASSLIIIRPSKGALDPEFLNHLCQSQLVISQVDAFVKGAGLPRLSILNLTRVIGTFPPISDQSIIAGFLDRETSKIDRLVTEQRRLMELLQEKRQAVISRAVTQGLNPSAALKPSGIEWIGDVPDHWRVDRIANVYREVDEPGIDSLPILSVSIHYGVSDTEIEEEEMERKVTRSDDRSKYKRVEPGDLVYNMMRAWQGGFGTVTVAGMVSPAYLVARPQVAIETAYVEHLLRTAGAIEQMRRHSRGVTDFRLRLYWDEFRNIEVALPPPEEAIAICAEIAEMDRKFSAMTDACEESIALLQERRTALISAAVTGQIDVRDWIEPAA